jgi:hypothetical protein
VSASTEEVQVLADRILGLIGQRIESGQLIIHYDHTKVQRAETKTMHTLDRKGPMRKP